MLRRHLNDAVTAGLLASGQPIDLGALLDRFDGKPFPTAFYTNKSTAFSAAYGSTNSSYSSGHRFTGGGHHRGAVQLNAMSVVLAAEVDCATNSLSPTSPVFSPRSPTTPSSSYSAAPWSNHRPTSPNSPSPMHEKWCPTLHPTYAKPN